MKIWLASTSGSNREGKLLVSFDEGRSFHLPPKGHGSIVHALEDWDAFMRSLDSVDRRAAISRHTLVLGAALPRTVQALYGSAYGNRGVRVEQLAGQPESQPRAVLMYQGASDRFLGPGEPLTLAAAGNELDVEAEVAVIVDDVPMGIRPERAGRHIRLVTALNDFTYRAQIREEKPLGFGFVRGKPLSAMAEFAVTPEALEDHWRGNVLIATAEVRINGKLLGRVPSDEMTPDFGHLIAHAAATRPLSAGTVISSGTVSSARGQGTASIIERRAVQSGDKAELQPFLSRGDSVEVAFLGATGSSLFGRMCNEIC
jgi:fumarylacetoacetate (FAA) hydrolase